RLAMRRLCFPFPSYRYVLALHSFPTRRSSDLLRMGGLTLYCRRLSSNQRWCGVTSQLTRAPRRRLRRTVSTASWVETWHMCSRVDRKSTRLNSSHVSISYAVFCLKKKKQAVTT